MPRIIIKTIIKAEIQIVFDLSRSIDLHKISTEHTNETAIAGKMSGLIELNESVTWRAKHLGVYQKMTSKITEYKKNEYFVDEMVEGAFKEFRHEHHFENVNEKTIMTDHFDFVSPFGILGKIVDVLFLKKYMAELLTKRNHTIKEFAESEQWKKVLNK
ncbi:MAG: SRPBCC family protein [Putridiphycobacter sp.]|nr:SRPBCC family protein [Putridiphycobacter sp.]